MQGLQTGSLRVEGLEGIVMVLDFYMEETPGNHSIAKVKGRTTENTICREEMSGRIITIHTTGAEHPLYSGVIQKISATEENGLYGLSLELISGTIRMDMLKENHSYQNVKMSYGDLIMQVAAQAGAEALYPPWLDNMTLKVPRIQYQETDWEFLKRIASHFNLPLYPEYTGDRTRVFVGIPESGEPGELEWTEYTAVMDDRYYETGGKEGGYARNRFISYEMESRENHACGERILFRGAELVICSKRCESRKGELIFTYRLANPEWAGQRRLHNERLSGLSLLGTVVSRTGETLRLNLDIDKEHQNQNSGGAYPFPWMPPTGNLMYLMPAEGSRVSLYFKGNDEESAIAVNCIRGEEEHVGNRYRERSLVTEHGKELKLYPDCAGIASADSHVLLNDQEGLSIRGKQGLRIAALGKVIVSGQKVLLDAGEGKLELYEGHPEEGMDGTLTFEKDAEFHLWKEGKEADSLGEKTILYASEKEDYSGNEYRFRDDPVEENYDYIGLTVQVLGGLVIVGGVALASGGVAAGAAATGIQVSATAVMGAAATGGSFAVVGLAATDLISHRVSKMDEYVKSALSGSIVGAMTGAAELIPAEGLARAALEFGAGASGSAVGQLIMDGEVDPARMLKEGILAMGMAEVGRWWRGEVGKKNDIDISDEGGYQSWDGKIPRSGDEWYEYLRDKYGAENVEWLTEKGYNKYFIGTPIRIKTHRGIEIQFTNGSQNTITYIEQNQKNIKIAIESAKSSKNIGTRIEGKVGEFVGRKTEVTQFGVRIRDTVTNLSVGDIDVATSTQIIEVKKSASVLKIEQIEKYVNSGHEKFFNFEGKEVIIYIDEPINWNNKSVANLIHDIESMSINGNYVKIVNSLEELEGVLK